MGEDELFLSEPKARPGLATMFAEQGFDSQERFDFVKKFVSIHPDERRPEDLSCLPEAPQGDLGRRTIGEQLRTTANAMVRFVRGTRQ